MLECVGCGREYPGKRASCPGCGQKSKPLVMAAAQQGGSGTTTTSQKLSIAPIEGAAGENWADIFATPVTVSESAFGIEPLSASGAAEGELASRLQGRWTPIVVALIAGVTLMVVGYVVAVTLFKVGG